MPATDLRLDHLAIAAAHAERIDDWPVAPRFNPSERWYHRLHVTGEYEVWVLTWLPGQGTDLHDHGGSAGAFHVLSGSLIEDTVTDGAPPRLIARELADGAGRRFGEHHIHRVTNRSTRPATSVHVYSPALTTMTRYAFGASGLEVTAIEKAGAEW